MNDLPAAARSCLAGIDVAILAGGLGTRIRAVLEDTPKVLAPVARRPLLDRLLDWLESYGADRVVLCLGHLADRVVAHVEAGPPRRCAIVPVVEPAPLGTAGALAFAQPTFRPGPVMVLNGDTLVDADLCAFVAAHRAATGPDGGPDGDGVAASLLCLEMADTGRYGRVEVADGRIRRFAEKDAAAQGPGVINAGVYLLGPELLAWMARTRPSSLERDVFQIQPPGRLGAAVGRFRFVDLGTPDSLVEAQNFFAAARD